MNAYVGDERRHPHWTDKWITPATITTLLTGLIGGIVWGVQLNMISVQNTADIGVLKGAAQACQTTNIAQNEQLARIAIILENIEKRITRNESNLNDHINEERARRAP